jgi:hypothetical protein
VKNLGSLNFRRCLVESINIVMFLVFEIAGNRYGGYDITFPLISVENDGFGVLSTASRFGFLEIAFRNRSQLFRTPTSTESGENAVLDVQLSIKILSSCAQASFHKRFLEVVAVGGKRKKGKKGK